MAQIQISEIEIPAPLPNSYTLALVSDTHGRFPAALYDALERQQVDGIALAGDLVDSAEDFSRGEVWEFLRRCSSAAPTVLALGNHERYTGPQQLRAINRTGVTVLNNTAARLGPLRLGGLTSGYFGPKRHSSEPDLDWLEEFSGEPGYKVLLCHHPEYYPRYIRERPIQLVLSGHAHGGQIRLAGRGLYAPGQGILPKYTAGGYENRLVVSPGVTNTVRLIPRLGNPRQLVVIRLGKC